MLERVLLVRDPDVCASLREQLLLRGIESVAVAATTTEFITPEQIPLESAWIACTSANGARGLFLALKAHGKSLPPRTRFAAVGTSTGRAVNEYFAQDPDVVAQEPTGAALARELVNLLPANTTVLHPCPDGHDSEFAEACRVGDLTVHTLPVYRTLSVHPARLATQLRQATPFGAAIFYAPSAVRATLAAHPLPWPFIAIAIGPTTHAALQRIGHSRIVTAERPADDAVLAALLSLPSQSESLHV